MRGVFVVALLLGGCAIHATPPGVRYIDAHAHLVPGLDPDEELARFRHAGVAGIVLMESDPAALAAVADRHPDYVTPFISAARLPEMNGLRIGPDIATRYAALRGAGAVCGFGELPTRVVPRTEASDAEAVVNPDRLQIYALADAARTPLTIHVSLETPEVIAAVDGILARYPRMQLILAHAGWRAGAGVIATLMAAHPNLYADLSVRLDPPAGWPAPGIDGPPVSTGVSILDDAGALRSDWRALIERRADRFLFGMDVTGFGSGRADHIDLLMATAKHALGGLPLSTQQAVAHGNIERLLAGCRRGAQ